VFAQRHHEEGETVTQFINLLRSLAVNCDFGASMEERLRDQLVIGINNDAWQKEVFRLHPTNASKLAQVEATALVLEQASVQQQRLHSLTRGAESYDNDRSTRCKTTIETPATIEAPDFTNFIGPNWTSDCKAVDSS
jgi:hypothetical protein